jgi:hypothetical protein
MYPRAIGAFAALLGLRFPRASRGEARGLGRVVLATSVVSRSDVVRQPVGLLRKGQSAGNAIRPRQARKFSSDPKFGPGV